MTGPGIDERNEWLEADGRGGYASGTAAGVRTRRYHALLLHATAPPSARMVLVNGFDAWIESAAGAHALTTQRYQGDVLHPDGVQRIVEFESEPWPRWRYRLENGVRIQFELFARHGTGTVALAWRLAGGEEVIEGDDSAADIRLVLRLFLSGRDPHATHHENPAFRFDAEMRPGAVSWKPYESVPGVVASHNGHYAHDPVWYRNFLYTKERERGLDCTEDLASPGTLSWDLRAGEAILLLSANGTGESDDIEPASDSYRRTLAVERMRRGRFASRLHRSADAYIVRSGSGRSIIAGYPWFAEWGRDTFVSLRGLCIASGRLTDARRILLRWTDTVSGGMVPNRIVEPAGKLEYDSVDAALWFVIAVREFLHAAGNDRRRCPLRDRDRLHDVVFDILRGYAGGTRHGIRVEDDGLLACGEPGLQLTWMDAKIGDRVITPRIGKPVEVNALWLNALAFGASIFPSWTDLLELGRHAFVDRFWNEADGCLFDVVDVGHVRGAVDDSFRPNQIFAVGGLPLQLVKGERARRIVDAVEERLLTPLGLRSLAPGSPDYHPHYEGGIEQRDGAYHQGTAWPWLMGAFVEAWLRTHDGPAAKAEAGQRFVAPLLEHLETAGLGHICEIADAEAPFNPRGCPFQAWSLGELMRLRSFAGPGRTRNEMSTPSRT